MATGKNSDQRIGNDCGSPKSGSDGDLAFDRIGSLVASIQDASLAVSAYHFDNISCICENESPIAVYPLDRPD